MSESASEPQEALRLSVLDLIPVRTGQSTAQALQASLQLAQTADALGFYRYWVAEHHNTAGVASTTPPVILGLIGSVTNRIRLGSGGVMLLNHQPLVVAEQFTLLAHAFPGRVDLGIGRAPGTDPVTSFVLRAGSDQRQQVAEYPQRVTELLELLAGQFSFELADGRLYPVAASPTLPARPPVVWLLGSSEYSARLAAELGVHYVFAHHFSGGDATGIVDRYRSAYCGTDQPRTFITANVLIADSDEQAQQLALPQLIGMARLHTQGGTGPQLTVEQAARAELTDEQRGLVERMRSRWVIGTAESVAERLRATATHFGVDEIMVHPIGGARESEPLTENAARTGTLQQLAEVFALK